MFRASVHRICPEEKTVIKAVFKTASEMEKKGKKKSKSGKVAVYRNGAVVHGGISQDGRGSQKSSCGKRGKHASDHPEFTGGEKRRQKNDEENGCYGDEKKSGVDEKVILRPGAVFTLRGPAAKKSQNESCAAAAKQAKEGKRGFRQKQDPVFTGFFQI